MKRIRMFLEQRRIHHLILYTIAADVVLGYLLKRYASMDTALPLAVMYLANIVVLIAVYRFWKLPVFECDESGFIVYGLSPFTKEICRWDRVEYVCFKELEVKKGRTREFLLLHYILPDGRHKTNMVPMYLVGFRDKLKSEFLGFMKSMGLQDKCQPGL